MTKNKLEIIFFSVQDQEKIIKAIINFNYSSIYLFKSYQLISIIAHCV